MANVHVYFLGKHPDCMSAVKDACKGRPQKPHAMFHQRVSPTGTQCICEGEFDSAFKAAPPANFTVMTYAEAHALGKLWDRDIIHTDGL